MIGLHGFISPKQFGDRLVRTINEIENPKENKLNLVHNRY
jgi:starvation-inducible outer membrane lipoprotein